MGQVISYIWPSSPQTQPEEQAQPAPQSNNEQKAEAPKPQAKPAIDRSIFIQKEKKDETIIRTPGQINGNQFLTDKLENCKVIVTDFCDSMTIDRCTNCEFVLACVRGSIFARNCTDCKFAMVCGQFRCRDCNNCDFFMHVKTGPVIESSNNLRIGCALVAYPEMAEHMKKARLDPAVNIWNDIHDFTVAEGNFTLSSGVKLDMDILKNDAQIILPFTYPPTYDATRFSVKLADEHWLNIVKRSQDELHLENTHRESDGNFTVEVVAESADAAREMFSQYSPLEVNQIQ